MKRRLNFFSSFPRRKPALALVLTLSAAMALWSCRIPAYDIGSCLNQCEADFNNCLWMDFYYSRTPENQDMPDPILGYLYCDHEQSTCQTRCGYLNE